MDKKRAVLMLKSDSIHISESWNRVYDGVELQWLIRIIQMASAPLYLFSALGVYLSYEDVITFRKFKHTTIFQSLPIVRTESSHK